ncbi:MAG: hypothetical protein COZ18_11740 [Flexibacter sp. CG_4_10_14_3_um_filter_32_15]|nr:MAG: hypothetical protein COZ18_11740 [Flexibacter sp. CG_4_10_14_3_um_filter_32_15]
MSRYNTREGKTFIAVVIILSLLLVVGAIWATNAFRNSSRETLEALYKDFNRLEQAYSNEIRNIDNELIPYQNADSLRQVLLTTRNDIKYEKMIITDSVNVALERMSELQQKKLDYSERLGQVYSGKDEYAIGEISQLKEELKKNRERIETLLKQIQSYKSQLASMTKKYKLSAAEVAKYKAEKAKLDKILSEQQTSLSQLEQIGEDRTKLRELLTQSEELIQRQKEEIERLKGLTRKAYNFTAQYDFQKRRVILDENGKHKGKIGKEVHLEFEVGEGLFEGDAQERIVYLTLYRNGKPYKVVKRPIPVLENGRTQAQIFVDKNLEDGDYYFDLTYKEESIMDKYKFRIR